MCVHLTSNSRLARCARARLSTLINRISSKGLKAAVAQVSYAVPSMLFTAWTAIKTGKPEKARCITIYV